MSPCAVTTWTMKLVKDNNPFVKKSIKDILTPKGIKAR